MNKLFLLVILLAMSCSEDAGHFETDVGFQPDAQVADSSFADMTRDASNDVGAAYDADMSNAGEAQIRFLIGFSGSASVSFEDNTVPDVTLSPLNLGLGERVWHTVGAGTLRWDFSDQFSPRSVTSVDLTDGDRVTAVLAGRDTDDPNSTLDDERAREWVVFRHQRESDFPITKSVVLVHSHATQPAIEQVFVDDKEVPDFNGLQFGEASDLFSTISGAQVYRVVFESGDEHLFSIPNGYGNQLVVAVFGYEPTEANEVEVDGRYTYVFGDDPNDFDYDPGRYGQNAAAPARLEMLNVTDSDLKLSYNSSFEMNVAAGEFTETRLFPSSKDLVVFFESAGQMASTSLDTLSVRRPRFSAEPGGFLAAVPEGLKLVNNSPDKRLFAANFTDTTMELTFGSAMVTVASDSSEGTNDPPLASGDTIQVRIDGQVAEFGVVLEEQHRVMVWRAGDNSLTGAVFVERRSVGTLDFTPE